MEVELAATISCTSDGSAVTDLEQYAANYEGFGKLKRLKFIAENSSGEQSTAAFQILFKVVKEGFNTSFYRKLCTQYKGNPQSLFSVFDEEWVESTDRQMMILLDMLERDLTTAKSSAVKESIRQAYNDIGNMHYQVGNLSEALKSYIRSRDYCSMVRHNCEMCLNVIKVSLDLDQYFNTTNFISKIGDAGGDAVAVGKVRAASGIISLQDSDYAAAARSFLDISPEVENQFNSTISAEDIGIYGGLCALATLPRSELKRFLVDKKQFLNSYLALAPNAKNLCLDFYHGRYGSCRAHLEALTPRLRMDIYMHKHISELSRLIYQRVLQQYFTPFSVVELPRMARALDVSEPQLEESLSELIGAGRLPARMDLSGEKKVYRAQTSDRQVLIAKLLTLSQKHTRELQRDMLRLSMMEQGFVVDALGSVAEMDSMAPLYNALGSRPSPQQDQQRTRQLQEQAWMGTAAGIGSVSSEVGLTTSGVATCSADAAEGTGTGGAGKVTGSVVGTEAGGEAEAEVDAEAMAMCESDHEQEEGEEEGEMQKVVGTPLQQGYAPTSSIPVELAVESSSVIGRVGAGGGGARLVRATAGGGVRAGLAGAGMDVVDPDSGTEGEDEEDD